MATLQIDMSGKAGLVERFFGETGSNTPAPNLRYIGPDGSIANGTYNPWAKYGYLTPANSGFVNLTGSLSNEWRTCVFDSSTSTIFIGENGAKLWEIQDSSTTMTLDTTISGTSIVITDMEIYQVNGVKKLFTAYQKSGGGDIQINSIPYGSANATWLTGTVSGAFTAGQNDNFFILSDNGFMYMGDGPSLHKIDGTSSGGSNGTVTANVLLFPIPFTLVDGVDFRGKTWLAIQTSTISGSNNTNSNNERVCGVYVWDRQTTQANMTNFIPLPGVREIRRIYIGPKGDLRVICVADTRLVQMRKFNGSYWGSTFDVIAEFPVNSEPVYRDSLDIIGGLSIWVGRDSKIYGYGSLTANDPEATYILGDASILSGSTTPGAIRAADANLNVNLQRQAIYFSGKDLVGHKWYPNGTASIDGTATGYSQTEIFYPVKWLPRMSTVKAVNIQCAPTTTGSTQEATISIYINQGTSTPYVYNVTRDDLSKGYYYINLNAQYVNSIQISITYPSGIQIGANTFTPAFANVEYTPTTTSQ